MQLGTKLLCFGLRQVLGDTVEQVAILVERCFCDPSRALPRALIKAHDQAWRALAVALAGDGFLDHVKGLLSSGEQRALREQVDRFLLDSAFDFPGSSAAFRKTCLAELHKARQAGLLSAGPLPAPEVARLTADYRRYAEPRALVDAACQAVAEIADGLGPEYPTLAQLLRKPLPGGPPLLAAAFAYFFRRQVETDDELARGLCFDGLQHLAAAQAQGFAAVAQALDTLGDRFDEALARLAQIEAAVVATHAAVLDLHGELQRLSGLHSAHAAELRQLMQEALAHLHRGGMQSGEVRPQHSLSIRGDDERRAVKQLLARFRRLPAEQQKEVPALLNGLGKLQIGTGEFAAARQTFAEVARTVADAPSQAEAHFNAYLAALEQGQWDDALAALRAATALDPQRFAPFPFQRYEARRILGAGGFGAVFLCHDHFFNADVVVKTLYASELDRSLDQVFHEAQVLRRLEHPAIIGVLECNYADLVAMARPYIVMEYFPGATLAAHVKEHGPLTPADLLPIARQIAAGMLEAHRHDVLHRDLKPDNVLLRRQDGGWEVKVIDFGLALQQRAVEASAARASVGHTVLGETLTGTFKYAPPEQLGELDGVKAGPYSDVYAFGKLCCYALFRTTEPKRRQWATIPNELAEVLERCTEQELTHRHPSFEPVLQALEALNLPAPAAAAPPPVSRPAAAPARVEAPAPPNGCALEGSEGALLVLDDAEVVRGRQNAWLRPGQSYDCTTAGFGGEPVAFALEYAPTAASGRSWSLRPALGALLAQLGQPSPTRAEPVCLPVRFTPRPPPKPGTVFRNSLGMYFAWVPPGTFRMGSPDDEPGRGEDEFPHEVDVQRGFYLGTHPVTQAEWHAVMGYNPSRFRRHDHPVEHVSWMDCEAFCQRLSGADGRRFVLPTEAEWEYACRAGRTTAYHGGATPAALRRIGWCSDQGWGSAGETRPVRSLAANAWGLFDLHGNVWEWCRSTYKPYPGDDRGVVQPTDERVARGGSWFDLPARCRCAARLAYDPAACNSAIGFRVAFYPDE
jgi:formylglycine-generating enzyme required for sulfatase activity/tRNA A-37 threonylcarbamoyl transferase component Bud32